jgi:hypothetical protein
MGSGQKRPRRRHEEGAGKAAIHGRDGDARGGERAAKHGRDKNKRDKGKRGAAIDGRDKNKRDEDTSEGGRQDQ